MMLGMNISRKAVTGFGKSLFTYRDSGTLEMRSGGGCLSLFGLPFLLTGLFVMQTPLGIVPVTGPSEPLSSVFLVLFGFVFAAVGACLVFGRRGTIIDRGMGRVVEWWGFLVPMKRREHMLDRIGQVEMDFSPGDSDSAATWPIRLSGEGLPKPIALTQPTEFAQARQLAEELSRFLRKPLVDSSTGERVTRDPDHLDEPLRERIRRLGENTTLPPDPPGMRSRVERTGEGYILHIPGASVSWLHYFPALISVLFAGAMAFFLLPGLLSLPMPDTVRYLVIGFIGLFFIAAPVASALFGVLKLGNQFERITVTKAYLRIEALRQGKRSSVEIPADELEDLVAPSLRSAAEAIEIPGMKKVPLGNTGSPRMPDGRPVPRFLLSLMKMTGSRGIIARSDRAVAEFAGGLDEAEKSYLFALIRRTIAG